MSVETTIVCDGCSMIGDASRKGVRYVRSQLREYGWRTALANGKDLCPECAAREEDRDDA